MKNFRIPNLNIPMPGRRAFAKRSLGILLGALVSSFSAQAEKVVVTVTNEGPDSGIWFVSPWIAFHDGSFDTFDMGAAASAGIEAIAEDGNTGPIDMMFTEVSPDGIFATLGGPTAPGVSQTYIFDLDPMNPDHRYLSYLAMLIPSNDAFIGNDDPMAVPVYDDEGSFVARSLTVLGSKVYDAGTEVNDEVPANTAFLAQMAPNTGTTENGTISMHPGFMPLGSGGILDASTDFGGSTSNFSAGDFTQPGYTLARITISKLNNPDTSSKLINISTRSIAGSGEDTQIGGFVIEGTDDKQVVIRAIGPSLEQLNVDGFLEDPTLVVFDADGNAIASNDDIGTQEGGQSALNALTAASFAAGAFGITSDSLDSALLLTLSPGAYTTHVVTKDGETGVALVEVYEVPE